MNQAQIRSTLAYFDHFNYPLTIQEINYWQSPLYNEVSPDRIIRTHGDYYYLDQSPNPVRERLKKEQESKKKWDRVLQISAALKKITFIEALFVTGSLAMNNAGEQDDIDIMVIASPDTLWITRALIVAYLKLNRIRRNPGIYTHSSVEVANKFCDNLYLDSNHLKISLNPQNRHHNLYLAHEILQAKLVFDKKNIYSKFIKINSWVKNYLPVAYKQQLQNSSSYVNSKDTNQGQPITKILNICLFCAQYLYMYSKITRERIGLGYAFFHPTSHLVITKTHQKITSTPFSTQTSHLTKHTIDS